MLTPAIQNKKEIYWVYIIGALFILTNAVAMLNGNYYLNAFPILLLIIYWAIFSLDKLLLLVVFFTPLSLTFREMLDKHVATDLSIPTEPILFGITILMFLKLLQGQKLDLKIVKHPVSITIYFSLAWMFITSISSTMPGVSIKFFVTRIWFVVPFFFLATQLFKDEKNIKRFFWLYIVAFTGVIFYTIFRHSLYDFAERPANWVVKPFYNDHTSYGAALAMFFPILIGFLFIKHYSNGLKAIVLIIIAWFFIAIVLSYTRAAWVSLAGALATLLFLFFKIKFKTLMVLLGIAAVLFVVFQDTIVEKLEKNNQDASNNFTEHVESISNISTDASNKERLNRWNCALRMFKQKPILGYGPGTYQFQYAPFQNNKEKTIISTNHGDAGNAHSEYLGPLAESGVLGAVSILLIVFVSMATGFRLFYTIKDKHLKLLTCIIILGLVTYFVHGSLNNFLDTDKASIPVWGFIAMLVAIDVYHNHPSPALPEGERGAA